MTRNHYVLTGCRTWQNKAAVQQEVTSLPLGSVLYIVGEEGWQKFIEGTFMGWRFRIKRSLKSLDWSGIDRVFAFHPFIDNSHSTLAVVNSAELHKVPVTIISRPLDFDEWEPALLAEQA